MADVPQVEGDRLFAIQIGARGDWFDKATGAVVQSKDAVKRFDRIWKIVARRLNFPTLARNIVTGTEVSYRSIGYSAGAAEWVRGGGRLSQRGVENIEFLLPGVAR